MMHPRIKPLRLEDLNHDQRAAYDDFRKNATNKGVIDPNTSMPAYPSVLLHNPNVYRASSTLGEAIVRHGGIPARERELVSLRVAWLCKAPVAWSNHTGHAHNIGISESEVERVTVGPDAEGWSSREKALLRLVDELHHSATVTDALWSELAEHFETSELVVLPLFVGSFHQVCYFFNTFAVPVPDPSRGGLAAR
jgi:alkylhydroperoxidase family enzyme